MDNDELFQTGFDGARQISYQYVANPEPVAALQGKRITHIACGEDHSAAVTSASLSAILPCAKVSLSHSSELQATARCTAGAAVETAGWATDPGRTSRCRWPCSRSRACAWPRSRAGRGKRWVDLLTRRMKMGSARTVSDARVRLVSRKFAVTATPSLGGVVRDG